jgi:hypothetical protein
MDNFDSVADNIIAWANKAEAQPDGRTFVQVIRIVSDKATDDVACSKMYARLCLLRKPVLNDDPMSPLCFRYMARGDSFTSLGRDAIDTTVTPQSEASADSEPSLPPTPPVGTRRHRSLNPSPVSANMPMWLRVDSDDSTQSDASTKFARLDYLAINTSVAQNEAGPECAISSLSSFMNTRRYQSSNPSPVFTTMPTSLRAVIDSSTQSDGSAAPPWTSYFSAPEGAMDEVLRTPVLDDEPMSPLCFRYKIRGDSATSLSHDVDAEDFFVPPVVPRSAPAHTSTFPFQPFSLGRSFFEAHPSGASSSSTVSVVSVGGTPRPARKSTGKLSRLAGRLFGTAS